MFRCHARGCEGHQEILRAIHHTQEFIVSSFADLTAAVQSAADAVAANTAAIDRIDADFAALKAALPPAGALSADEQAALDGAVSSLGTSIASLTAATGAVDAADPAPAPPAA
jgi:hypothetical protein